MRREEYSEANRQAWNEAGPIHAESQLAGLLDDFRRPGHSCLDQTATATLRKIGLAGKAVAQLCCNNGRELLSVRNLGAGRCVGFDISEAFIAQARELAAAGGIECDFVATDIYAIAPGHDGRFDLVIITIGALCWMPDLRAFMAVAARLLHRGGRVFVYEQHPIADMFETDRPANPLELRYSYFDPGPYPSDHGLDYWTGRRYAARPSYSFHHKLSDVLGACIGAGFALESFVEHDHDISSLFAAIEAQPIRPPLSYSLVARKAD